METDNFTKVPFELRFVTTDDPVGQRYFHGLKIHVDGKILLISSGNLDSIAVFRDPKGYSVLSYNRRYEYAGVETFDLNGVRVNSVFYQGEELMKVIGPQGLAQSDLDLVLLLSDRI